jgi:hypothetical protein
MRNPSFLNSKFIQEKKSCETNESGHPRQSNHPAQSIPLPFWPITIDRRADRIEGNSAYFLKRCKRLRRRSTASRRRSLPLEIWGS